MTQTPTDAAGPQATYEAFLRSGRFLIQRSWSTGEYVFYPKVVAPSGATDLEWREPSGLGTVYAFTVNRDKAGSYNIALVELDEGVRMISTIAGVESVPVGTRVKAEIEGTGETARVVFRPLQGAEEASR